MKEKVYAIDSEEYEKLKRIIKENITLRHDVTFWKLLAIGLLSAVSGAIGGVLAGFLVKFISR